MLEETYAKRTVLDTVLQYQITDLNNNVIQSMSNQMKSPQNVVKLAHRKLGIAMQTIWYGPQII